MEQPAATRADEEKIAIIVIDERRRGNVRISSPLMGHVRRSRDPRFTYSVTMAEEIRSEVGPFHWWQVVRYDRHRPGDIKGMLLRAQEQHKAITTINALEDRLSRLSRHYRIPIEVEGYK